MVIAEQVEIHLIDESRAVGKRSALRSELVDLRHSPPVLERDGSGEVSRCIARGYRADSLVILACTAAAIQSEEGEIRVCLRKLISWTRRARRCQLRDHCSIEGCVERRHDGCARSRNCDLPKLRRS